MTLAHYIFSAADTDHIPDLPAARSHTDTDARAEPDTKTLQIQQGNEDAFRAFMLEQYTAVIRFTTSIIKNADAADDITQDVFTRLWNARADLDPSRSLRAYVFTTARNLALNWIKADVSRQRLRDRLAQDAPEQSEILTQFDNPSFDPTRLAALVSAIAALPERRRTALALRFTENLTYAEAGLVLGISAKAMQQLVIRTVRELRRTLGVVS